jgi:hypothetical protein
MKRYLTTLLVCLVCLAGIAQEQHQRPQRPRMTPEEYQAKQKWFCRSEFMYARRKLSKSRKNYCIFNFYIDHIFLYAFYR